ncbi:MAG: DNA-directed RNA polymerase subunit B [Candidatus Aenigmatarchaeota archaeon]|nr:DNA-directed RNA polymerase subunit B [Candidatus Aenigmarchaeota archaeon]
MEFQPLLRAFKDEIGFVRFQIESYNDFIENRLQRIFDEIKEIKPEIPEIGELILKFGKVTIGEPSIQEADGSIRKILPYEARIRELTYSAPVYLEIKPIINKVEQEPVNVHVCDIPIMVKSRLCPLSTMSREQLEEINEDPDDPGGYFIINGIERMLVLIEEIASNQFIIEKQNIGNYTEILRLNSEANGYIQRHTLERKNDGSIVISFASLKRVPIIVIFKALGIEKDKEIIDLISSEEKIISDFYPNLYTSEVQTQKDAYEFLGNLLKIPKEYVKSRIDLILDMYFLPHIGQEAKDRKEKAKYLGYLINKIIKVGLDILPEDDIDHYKNKRIKLACDLLELLLRSIIISRYGLIARIKYNYQKMAKRGKLPPLQTIVEANAVTNQIISALATGLWPGGRTGVSQRLERKNYLETLSYLRLVLSPLTTTQEHFEARELHATHFGRFCPAETPEGPTIGLRKHLALFAEITKGISHVEEKKFLNSIKSYIKDKEKEDDTIIFYNGKILGYTNKPKEFVEYIRKERRNSNISKEINVSYRKIENEIIIFSGPGRVRRPLILVENGTPKLTKEHIEKLKEKTMTWYDLIKNSIIEYLDAAEEDDMLVAFYPENVTKEHNYLEISPLTLLGVSASAIPFPEHNRGDRVNFGAKMVCQAIGIPLISYPLRVDSKFNILIYPQTPLVETVTTSTIGIDHHPIGQNVIVAIASYTGYNMEDGVIFNKASVERGLLRSYFYRVYSIEEKKYWGGQKDKIGIPDKDVNGYKSEEAYSYLSSDGIVNPETIIKPGGVLVGRTSPLRFLSANELISGIANTRETSLCMRPQEGGIVDKVFITENINGNKFVQVSVRDLRVPEVGDKFASRHGQKSVIGIILDQNNMPFSASGVIPDIIINPHAIQSRQTIGQVLEILCGKAAALSGKKIDATAFSKLNIEDIKNLLREAGFRSDGKESFYNSYTGERMEFEIFVGMQWYLKLDHMVANKLQSRSTGPVTLLTRQPTEGKAKEGGLRLGEMEKDVLIAHGAVLTLKERFESDKVKVPICKSCGILASWSKTKDKYICPICGESEIEEVEISFAFKLMLDELKSMFIYPKIVLNGG